MWAFAPYEVTVFHCVWSKKEDADCQGLYGFSKLPIVWIWTGSQLLSSGSRTSSEVLSRNHYLLWLVSDLYLFFTSICSPTSVKQFITFLTMVVVQLLSVPQILRTPETCSFGGEGTTRSWCSWLGPRMQKVVCLCTTKLALNPKTGLAAARHQNTSCRCPTCSSQDWLKTAMSSMYTVWASDS